MTRRTALALAVCAASGAASVALTATQVRATPAALKPWQEGSPAPFVLPDTAMRPVSLEAYRGRVSLLHFFATWCEPCREEFPALTRLVARAATHDLAVLAISVAEPPPRVQRFLETMPVNFPVLLDQDRAVARGWSVSALPSTVILDRTLKPRLYVESDFAWDGVDLTDLVKTMSTSAHLPDASRRAQSRLAQ